jgi:transposase
VGNSKVWRDPILAAKKYHVDLNDEERKQLQQLTRQGKHSSRKVMRALVLLKAEEGFSDSEIASAIGISIPTIERTRKRFIEEGLGALNERQRPGPAPKLSGKQEAHLIAIACSAPPEGRQRWTLRLLADKVVELGLAASYSHEAARRVLKKTSLSRGRKSNGVFRK